MLLVEKIQNTAISLLNLEWYHYTLITEPLNVFAWRSIPLKPHRINFPNFGTWYFSKVSIFLASSYSSHQNDVISLMNRCENDGMFKQFRTLYNSKEILKKHWTKTVNEHCCISWTNGNYFRSTFLALNEKWFAKTVSLATYHVPQTLLISSKTHACMHMYTHGRTDMMRKNF